MCDRACVPRNRGSVFQKGHGVIVGVEEQDFGLHLLAQRGEARDHF